MMHFFKKKNIDVFPVLLFLIAFLTWRGAFYRISLYVAIPALIVVSFFRWGKTIISSKCWWPYFLLIIWIFISSLLSDYQSMSFQRMIPIIASFLLSFSVYATALRGNNSKILYFSYCLFFVYLMLMSFADTGFVQDFDYTSEHDRESYTKMDANSYAYYSFFLIMSVRMVLVRRNKPFPKGFLLIIYVTLLVITIYVALLTAARQVMYLNIPLIFLFILYDFVRNGKQGGWLLFVVATVVLVAVGLPIFSKYYNTSFLATRSEVSFAEDGRSRMMKNAMNLAFENPIFGVGLGAPITFSHNTYTHLASRCGLPSLFLYIILLLQSVYAQFKRWRMTKDGTFILHMLCCCFYIVGNFLYSYIDGPFMMAFLFILIGDGERYQKESLQMRIK